MANASRHWSRLRRSDILCRRSQSRHIRRNLDAAGSTGPYLSACRQPPCSGASCSASKYRELIADAEKHLGKATAKYDERVKARRGLTKRLVSLSKEGKLTLEEAAAAKSALATLSSTLTEIESLRPATGSIFVRAFLGQVNVRASTTKDRAKLRDEYNKFKDRTNLGECRRRNGQGNACTSIAQGGAWCSSCLPCALCHLAVPLSYLLPLLARSTVVVLTSPSPIRPHLGPAPALLQASSCSLWCGSSCTCTCATRGGTRTGSTSSRTSGCCTTTSREYRTVQMTHYRAS